MSSNFFATLDRLRWIQRWGLKRNVSPENVMEHSWQVTTIAHALAELAVLNGKDIDVNEVIKAALYHDVSEIITGDLPTPVKYHSDTIRDAYKAIEKEAEQELLEQLPAKLHNAYRNYLLSEHMAEPVAQLVKAADLISALIKCNYEVRAGNKAEFGDAQASIQARLGRLQLPEVDEFLTQFMDGYILTLDQLLAHHDPKPN